ncbi:MAG: DNA mismatch repair endonuclease MutL [Firmicutes bacterium]|nr:DNA mismatch repair endonuclease MutL [Bacillota bacterium]
MKEIKLLDKATINKIAAGEVIERPGSVVKELVENSIDAGADFITIEIKEGGISFIKVSDNGKGIAKDYVKTAFLSHATSKLSEIEDLEFIMSMGFRGEALASIAAVARVEMVTKTADDTLGTKIEINGGEFVSETNVSCSEGTVITVKNLFYNVPARKKFLRKPSAEAAYISDMINKLALGHKDISFKYINNGTEILYTSGNNDLRTVFYSIYGKNAAMKTIPMEYISGNLKISGLLGKPDLVRSNRSYESIYVNGRYVKNSLISSAVEEAYKTRIIIGKFPVFVLDLRLPPALVDVNVHPAKTEIRFSDEKQIYEFVFNAVNKTLKSLILIKQDDFEGKTTKDVRELMDNEPVYFVEEPENEPAAIDMKKAFENDSDIFEPGAWEKTSDAETSAEKGAAENVSYNNEHAPVEIPETGEINWNKGAFKFKEPSASYTAYKTVEKISLDDTFYEKNEPGNKAFFKNYRIVGQIFSTYWIIEQERSMYIIDQHAAHERILFEQFMNKYKDGSVISQRLLEPMKLNLTEKEKYVLEENEKMLSDFGFDIEEDSTGGYALSSVPMIFQNPAGEDFFMDILSALEKNNVKSVYDTKELAIATEACKAAVKGNNKLSYEEADEIIKGLLKLENPFTCPHGRPTIIQMPKYELEKKFKRIQ